MTFVNLPSQQNGTQRFGNPGAPGAASYLEGPGAPTVTDSYVDVGFFDTPGGLQPTVGNFIRIAIDIAASGVAPGDVYATFNVNRKPRPDISCWPPDRWSPSITPSSIRSYSNNAS